MQRLLISKYAAFTLAVLIPLGETVRRWNEIIGFRNIMFWIDDYILAVILFSSAYSTHRNPLSGQRYLIAAWGIAVGGLSLSFMSQLTGPFVEASGYSSWIVAAIKGVLLLICIICLVFALSRIERSPRP